ncbi:MAG: YhbY family RNA-binding protein [Methanosarcinaceae archaeon]|nr:YhbY family RNA-binding protein [Methanosarcinaceae archaeon]
MNKEKMKELKRDASHIKPIINIGKKGVDEAVVAELKKQIKARHLVKVKVLKSASYEDDIEVIAQKLSESTNSTLINIRGGTVVLYR